MRNSRKVDVPLVNEELPTSTESNGGAPFSRRIRREFTREFKVAVIRSIEEGAPLKRIARAHNIDPARIRAWRDELRDVGPEAFLRTEGWRITKEIKEAAVKRVEAGTPLKEVARACRVDSTELRRWRTAWRTLGPEAFDVPKKEARPKAEPKPKLVIFRLNDAELKQLKAMAKAAGVRSLAEFARRRLIEETARSLRDVEP